MDCPLGLLWVGKPRILRGCRAGAGPPRQMAGGLLGLSLGLRAFSVHFCKRPFANSQVTCDWVPSVQRYTSGWAFSADRRSPSDCVAAITCIRFTPGLSRALSMTALPTYPMGRLAVFSSRS